MGPAHVSRAHKHEGQEFANRDEASNIRWINCPKVKLLVHTDGWFRWDKIGALWCQPVRRSLPNAFPHRAEILKFDSKQGCHWSHPSTAALLSRTKPLLEDFAVLTGSGFQDAEMNCRNSWRERHSYSPCIVSTSPWLWIHRPFVKFPNSSSRTDAMVSYANFFEQIILLIFRKEILPFFPKRPFQKYSDFLL